MKGKRRPCGSFLPYFRGISSAFVFICRHLPDNWWRCRSGEITPLGAAVFVLSQPPFPPLVEIRLAVNAVVTNFDERLPTAQQRLQRDDRTGEIHGCEAHDIQEGGAAAAHNIVAICSVGQGYRIDTAGGEESRHPVDLGVAEIPDLRERSKYERCHLEYSIG